MNFQPLYAAVWWMVEFVFWNDSRVIVAIAGDVVLVRESAR
jgi:hypothetical protein